MLDGIIHNDAIRDVIPNAHLNKGEARTVISWLDGDGDFAIAEKYGISYERVRKLRHSALEKIAYTSYRMGYRDNPKK